MAATSAPAIPGTPEPRAVPRRSVILVAAGGIAAAAFLLGVVVASLGVGSEAQIHLGPMAAPVLQVAAPH